MARNKFEGMNISTGKDTSSKPQRVKAYSAAALVTMLVLSVGLFVACDSGISDSSVLNTMALDWEKNVRGTEWKRESGSAVFEENEILKAVSACDTLNIDSGNRLMFSGGAYGNVNDPESVLDFDDVAQGTENCDGDVDIGENDFDFHFSRTGDGTTWFLSLTEDNSRKSLLYKCVKK